MSAEVLPPDGVDVWWCSIGAWDPWVADLLPQDERLRAARFRKAADRRRFVTAHALVRVLLGRYLGTDPAGLALVAECGECGGGGHGKPRLVGGEFEFSLSHAGCWVGVAVARVPVGIDVERRGEGAADPDLAREVLGPEEFAAWERLSDPQCGLTRWWTRKEAVLKAAGVGLNVAVAALRVSGPDETPRVLGWPGHEEYDLHDLRPGPGYLGALAVRRGGARHVVRERDGEELLRR